MVRALLHVGCGARNPDKVPVPFRNEAWREIRLDVEPAVTPDVVASMTSMPAIASESIDAVLCAHSLEHLYPHEVRRALGEFRRVLRWGGFVLITVPDLTQAAAMIAQGRPDQVIYDAKVGPITAHDVVFGYARAIENGRIHMAHHSGFVPSQLLRVLDAAGFGGKKWSIANHNIWAMAFKGQPADGAPGLGACIIR